MFGEQCSKNWIFHQLQWKYTHCVVNQKLFMGIEHRFRLLCTTLHNTTPVPNTIKRCNSTPRVPTCLTVSKYVECEPELNFRNFWVPLNVHTIVKVFTHYPSFNVTNITGHRLGTTQEISVLKKRFTAFLGPCLRSYCISDKYYCD